MAFPCLFQTFGSTVRTAGAGPALRLLRPSTLPWILPVQPVQHRSPGHTLRVQSTAAPYWDDDTKSRLNVYTDYTIYKGKAAMAIKVIKPTWEAKSSGLAIQREGTVLLEFAPNVGTQTYDWSRKETFALSAVECAGVLDAADARQEWSAYHDPNKNSAGEGTTRKQLAMRPAPDRGWFFTLNSNQSGAPVQISCNVTDTELRVVKTLFTFLIPRLLGFDEHFQGAPSVINSDTAAPAAAADGAPF